MVMFKESNRNVKEAVFCWISAEQRNPIYQVNSLGVLKYLAEKWCGLKKPVVPILSFEIWKFYQIFVTFQIDYSGSSVTTFWFVCLHLTIVTRHSPILPLCHTSLATFGVKIRLFWKTVGVTQLFSGHISKTATVTRDI